MTVDGYRRADHAGGDATISRRRASTSTTPAPRRSRARGINVPLAYTTAYTVFGLGCVVASADPQQCRLARRRSPCRRPQGAILNAPKPAAVCIRHVIGQMLPDVVFGCLRQVIPERVPAEGTSCLWNLIVRGRRRAAPAATTGSRWRSRRNGGTGARADKDGLSATAYPMRRASGTPVEIAETHTPLIFWKKELRPDSGGAGPHPRRARPDHRDRERHRRALRHARRLRPHRSSPARPRAAASRARRAPSPSRTAAP